MNDRQTMIAKLPQMEGLEITIDGHPDFPSVGIRNQFMAEATYLRAAEVHLVIAALHAALDEMENG